MEVEIVNKKDPDKPDIPVNPITYNRRKIFVRHIWGKFQAKRWMVFSFFLTLFYALPWIRINGKQPLLFNIPERKFHIFFTTLWPQEVYLLTFTLITGALFLFFSTALVGRVWCGYLCPQTVFTSVFLEIERFILGDSVQQIKLSKKPMRGEKLLKLTIRNIVWGAIALFTGFTFSSYFTPNDQLFNLIISGSLGGWGLFWFLLISGFAFFDFGFFREQFCFVPCPYGRFQGALQDPHSLVVTYDKKKGEGDKEKNIKPACISCNLCVQVCPTGIDIRRGAQFECISCARCIDVCAVVQEKKGRTPDLIRYDSENSFKGLPTKIIRPRVILYAVLMTILISTILFKLVTRPGFDFQVIKNREMIYQELPNGKVLNTYTLKVWNMSDEDQTYTLKVEELPNPDVIMGSNTIALKAGENTELSISVIAKKDQMKEKVNDFHVELIRNETQREISKRTTFLVP